MLLMLVVFCVFGNSTYHVEVLTTSVVVLMSFVLIVIVHLYFMLVRPYFCLLYCMYVCIQDHIQLNSIISTSD